jgi:hypothetical protein
MKAFLIKFTVLPLLAGVLGSCETFDYRLLTVNRSPLRLAIYHGRDTVPAYPSVNKTGYYLAHVTAPGDSTTHVVYGRNGWPNAVKASTNQQLHLFLYPPDSLIKYGDIDSLIRHRAYRRLNVTSDELKRQHWRVIVR